MARNNKNTYTYKTNNDLMRRAREKQKSIDTYSENKFETTKQDINNIAETLLKGRDVVVNSNIGTINPKKYTFNSKEANKNYEYSKVTNAIKQLYENDFYDVISNKVSTAEDLLLKSVDNAKKVYINNQKGKSNENLYSVMQKYESMQNIKENNGKYFVYDLETLGGKDAYGIWRPTHITEYSMHEYGVDGSANKVDIILGWRDKKANEELLSRIETAINDGSIEFDEELRVTAHRLSLYGDKRTRVAKDNKTGYFKMENFIDSDEGDFRDLDRIKEGAKLFERIGRETDVDKYGVPADVRAMMESLSHVQNNLKKDYSMLIDYNGSLHDLPIMNLVGNQNLEQFPILKEQFKNGFKFNPDADTHFDFFGMMQHFRSNFSTKDLLGDSITDITENRLNRQEHYVKALYEGLFKSEGLRPHEASSDVQALSFFFTQKSDKLGGKTLMDFMGEKLQTVVANKTVYELNPMEHIFKAKAFNNGTYGGKNILNFAIDKENNKIFTADNHMIRDGKVQKKDFHVGTGINQGAYYKLRAMGEFETKDKYIDIVKEAFPQYASGKLYSVTLDMMTAEGYEGTRLDNLSQVFIFDSETERDAFLGNTLDVVAQRGKDGKYKILDRDAFDIREYDMIKGHPVFKDVNKNWSKSDEELINSAVLHENRKLTTSRAENAINGDNAYRKLGQALEIQKLAEKEMGRKISDRELNYIMSMSDKVSKGKMAITIDDNVKSAMQKGVKEILEWKGEIYDSTIDNMSTYMNTIANNEAYYNKLFEVLNKHEKFGNESPMAVKKELFKRADRHARETLATGIYNNDARIKKSILGDESLQTSLSKFKNMYEIDLSKMAGSQRIQYYDITQANPSNLLRLDLGKTGNLDYNLVGAVTKALYGDKKFKTDDMFAIENRDFRKFIKMMLEDDVFNQSLDKSFRSELKDIAYKNKEYHHIDVADRMVQQFSSIKQADPFAGIMSKELYMKDLTSSSGFTKALNGEEFLKTLESEITNLLDNTNLAILNGSKTKAKSFVENNLLKHYVPANPTELIHKKATEEMTNYLTELVHSIDKIGASLSVNDAGDITMHDAGKVITLNLPKIQKDVDSGTWFIETGNMKNTLSLNLKAKSTSGGYGIDMNINTTFGESVGTYPMSKSVENFYKKKGSTATKESMDYIETFVNTGKKKLIKNPTINSFNGNDANSNRYINVSGISEVLPEMFGENGKLNYLVKNKQFLDKGLQDTIMKDIAKHLKYSDTLEELDAFMIKDLQKNLPHVLEIMAIKAGVNGTEVGELIKQISFTTNDKKMSKLTGIVGDMPLFAPQAALDNIQRPPVLSAGNAIPIRMENVQKLQAEGSGVLAGNLISSASIDKATMRHVAGVGETTTDVMMDIAYVSTNALDIMKENHMAKVLNKNNVDDNYKERMTSMFAKLSKVNTYEQERHLDGRIAERLYGLMSAKVQNISASKDIVSAVNMMDLEDASKQIDDIVNLKGNITIDQAGVLSYKSATGKFVKRGDDVVKILGFGDTLETISPNMQNGIFLHKYVKSNGMVLTDSEISNILNKNKSLFLKDGVLDNKITTTSILDDIIQKEYSASGVYRIQDISAAGFIKPTTSSTEKGMTNLNYVKTGTLDKNVDKFFKSIGMEHISRQSVLTEEGIDAIIAHVGDKKVTRALNQTFGSVDKLKEAINVERNMFNKFLMDDVFQGKAHMLVNDGVFKHGGAGQLQFGILNKAIDNLIKHNKGDVNKTLEEVTDIINSNKEYQFLQTRNLNTSKSAYTKFRIKDGRIHMDDMGTNIENLTVSNIEKLENLVTELDRRAGGGLVHTKGYIQKWNKEKEKMEIVSLEETGQKLFGEWTTEKIEGKDVYMNPITKESVKLLPDVETQTGTESRYFEIQETLKQLKSRKNSTNDPTERDKLIGQISKLEQELKNYESVSKRMSIGSTEYQLLERIRVTEQHAQQMQSLIAKGELTDEILASEALKGKVRMVDGRIEIDDKMKAPVLDHWLKRFRDQLTYNPLREEKLTKEIVAKDEYKHLANILERAEKFNFNIGLESAEKLHSLEMADIAVKYNKDGSYTKEAMNKLGFETRAIDNINFEVDEIAQKNLLIDLGPEFQGKNRYMAVAGTGHIMDEDEEILTNGQKEIRKLAHKYEDWQLVKHDAKLSAEAKEKVNEQATETVEAIRKSIYGKNALSDELNKVQVDDINYRYKASGAVTSELTPGLNQATRRAGSDIQIDNELLKSRVINGKSLAEWHEKGIHYDYKFVSLEAMQDMGMFKESTMKAYGAKDRNDMINILKRTGTMDITDRYPNNKNDSMLLTHVFLDEDLVGNQTKVAGVSGLKMLLDHDGDSVSSFALRYKNADGSFVDYGMFVNNPDMVKKTNMEAYEAFSNMLGTTTMRAATENKKWLEDVNKILVDDAIKNSSMGDLTKTALVPGGDSILGKVAPAAISHMDTLEGTNQNFEAVDSMINQAKDYIKNGQVETKINIEDLDLAKNKSEIVLDKALTIMQDAKSAGLISGDDLTAYESTALKRVAIDKASVAASAKTGVATTGAINVATNSIKKATHDSLIDRDPTTVDIFRSILDIPEQEAISSKKIISAYDDRRARDMTEILNNMFGSRENANFGIKTTDMKDLRNWFETHAKGKVEDVYDEFASRLDTNRIRYVEEGGSKFNAVMGLFEENLKDLANDEYFQARRLHYKSRGAISEGAAYNGDDFVGRVGQALGKSDDTYMTRAAEKASIREEAFERAKYAKQFHATPNMVKETTQAASNWIQDMPISQGMKVGSGLGMAVLGLAGGLMAAGYASGNPLNDKSASQVSEEQQPVQTMSIPEFMDKQGGYVTGNSQQGYIINIKADTKKGRKHMQRVMKQAAQASVGGAVSVNMNIKNSKQRGITDADIENFLERNL